MSGWRFQYSHPFNLDSVFSRSGSVFNQAQRSPSYEQDYGRGLSSGEFSPDHHRQQHHGSMSSLSSGLWRSPSVTSVSSQSDSDDTHWEIMLDISRFEHSEIVVKGIENRVIVSAKHEDNENGYNFVSREFSRQYQLPSNVDPETVTSTLSHDGILTIRAPKMQRPPAKERIIPVELLKPPANLTENSLNGGCHSVDSDLGDIEERSSESDLFESEQHLEAEQKIDDSDTNMADTGNTSS
ncbi:heat shock protein 27-like [Saccoglossus kowalevskii]|uniref:Protein lethal(2)essential for life-like n=1 Tax=Saccoglossus kowalevskii TaxID=10224 RepID=A0ABM0ML65_SACKO|nr:PREDICTED: protein lethal(2)essential for life-like [Saccoglossus kowalevskii]